MYFSTFRILGQGLCFYLLSFSSIRAHPNNVEWGWSCNCSINRHSSVVAEDELTFSCVLSSSDSGFGHEGVVCSKQNTLRKIQSDELGLLSTSCQCNVWFSRDLSCSIQIRVFCVLSSLFVGIFSDKLNRCCKGCYCSTRKLHRWLIWSENSFHSVKYCMEGFLSNTIMKECDHISKFYHNVEVPVFTEADVDGSGCYRTYLTIKNDIT